MAISIAVMAHSEWPLYLPARLSGAVWWKESAFGDATVALGDSTGRSSSSLWRLQWQECKSALSATTGGKGGQARWGPVLTKAALDKADMPSQWVASKQQANGGTHDGHWPQCMTHEALSTVATSVRPSTGNVFKQSSFCAHQQAKEELPINQTARGYSLDALFLLCK